MSSCLAFMGRVTLVVVSGWIGVACESATPPSGDVAPGFRSIHDQILVPSCGAAACHGEPNGTAGFTVGDPEKAWADLVGVTPVSASATDAGLLRVTPGDPERSFLWKKMTSSPEELQVSEWGAPMPLAGTQVPGPESLAAIRAWIEAGASLEGADVPTVDWSDPDSQEYVLCDATDEPGMQACFDAPSQGATRLYTPPLTIPAASEVILCAPVPTPLAEDLLFVSAQGAQMVGGHHIAVYVRDAIGDEPPHPCDDGDMLELRFLAGAGGAGGVSLTLAEGTALRARAGQQLVIQSHYINTDPEPRIVMDAVDLIPPEQMEGLKIADAFAVIADDFSVPPFAEEYEAVKDCLIDREIDVHLMLGHTHDFGVFFQLEHIPVGAEPEVLYWATDGPLLRDDPDVLLFEGSGLHLAEGDRIRITCRWTNTTPATLGWPEEMCVGFMYYTPGEGFLLCDSSSETPGVLGGGEPSDGCAIPNDGGNSIGVGKFCTVAGTECQGNGSATLCLAAIDPSSNFCSLVGCETDADCGEEAVCVIQSLGSGCAPAKCLEP